MNESRPRPALLDGRRPQVRRPEPDGAAQSRTQQDRPAGRGAIPARHHVAGHGQRRAQIRRVRHAVCVRRRALCVLRRLRHPSRLAISCDHRRRVAASTVDRLELDRRLPDDRAACAPAACLGWILLVWTGAFALLAVVGFFLKISGDFSRFLFGLWFVTGVVLALAIRLVMARLVRRWARNGRMERRAVIVGGGKAAEELIRSIEQQPYNDIRICGIFDDRDDTPLAADRGRLSQARQHLGTDRVRPHHAYRHADRVAADDRRGARALPAEEAVGAAGRHPALGALQPVAVPAALLFLYRLGADARHLRQAHQRLGFGRQARLRHRLLDASASCCSRRSCWRPRSPSSSTARAR